MARRGRPTGHRLSAESKRQISKSKTGYIHDKITKEKISDSMFNWWTDHPTPHIIEDNRRCMCRKPKHNKVSIFMLYWWDRHPEVREAHAKKMKEWHAKHPDARINFLQGAKKRNEGPHIK